MKGIKLILGSMNFGPQVNNEDAKKMVRFFHESGFDEIDTAYVYNEGRTEEMLGEILPDLNVNGLKIATKIHPRITGKLDGDSLLSQFSQSLRRMGLNKVDILYFHFPDKLTPIESALSKCNQLYEQGKIKELGLSNFPAWKVMDVWHLCDKNGWIKPTVYQGMYNGLCRNVEPELFPALRCLGIRFYAYNPLAGGMLTGKHTNFEEIPQSGRFSRLQSYRNRYWKKNYFEAVSIFLTACQQEGVQPVEAALRWLIHHSCLDREKGDGIVIGASSMEQLEQNIFYSGKNDLPENIVDALNDAWSDAKPESPDYYQFFPK